MQTIYAVSNSYLVSEIMSLDHPEAIQRCGPHGEQQSKSRRRSGHISLMEDQLQDTCNNKYSRCLDERKLQHVFAECVFDLAIHVFSERGEVNGDVLRCGVVLAHLEDYLLGRVVTDREVDELDTVVIRR